MARTDRAGEAAAMDPSEQNTFYIEGTRVKLKDRLPLKISGHLPKLLNGVEDDYHNVARLGMLLVEEWDFDGNPALMSSWESFDSLSEIPAFALEIGKNLNARQERAGVPKG
jgi:hypothetical protein